ncbi:hypothetical protein CJ483_12270 [Bacillus sp. PK3_68]|nr:hypothetical protein CJ483_12270 [Bacillus sp. PK3_68]
MKCKEKRKALAQHASGLELSTRSRFSDFDRESEISVRVSACSWTKEKRKALAQHASGLELSTRSRLSDFDRESEISVRVSACSWTKEKRKALIQHDRGLGKFQEAWFLDPCRRCAPFLSQRLSIPNGTDKRAYLRTN